MQAFCVFRNSSMLFFPLCVNYGRGSLLIITPLESKDLQICTMGHDRRHASLKKGKSCYHQECYTAPQLYGNTSFLQGRFHSPFEGRNSPIIRRSRLACFFFPFCSEEEINFCLWCYYLCEDFWRKLAKRERANTPSNSKSGKTEWIEMLYHDKKRKTMPFSYTALTRDLTKRRPYFSRIEMSPKLLKVWFRDTALFSFISRESLSRCAPLMKSGTETCQGKEVKERGKKVQK